MRIVIPSNVKFSGNAVIGSNLTVDNNTFFIDDTNNRLGVGTKNPQSTIHVDGNSFINGNIVSKEYIQIRGTSNTGAELRLNEDTDNGTNYVSLKAPSSISSDLTFTLPSADGDTGQVLKTNGSGAMSWIDQISDVVDDTTPQLGGNLDTNEQSIVSVSNRNINIVPHGTGFLNVESNINIKGGIIDLYDTDQSNVLRLKAPALTSDVTLTLPTSDGNSGQILKTDGSGNLSWVSTEATELSLTLGGDLVTNGHPITSTSNNDIRFQPHGTGVFKVDGNARITGNLHVGPNTLYFDAYNDRVGIGTKNPDEALHVVGKSKISSNMQITENINVDGNIITEENIHLQKDSSILYFGNDDDVSITHVADTGIRLNSGMKLQFRDNDVHVSSDADGYMNLQADTGVNINIGGTDEIAITSSTTTLGTNLLIPDSGTIGSASATSTMSISSGGVLNVATSTDSTSSTNGALTVTGGVGIAKDLCVGNDLKMISDSSVISWGADSEITLTHNADKGITLSGSNANGTVLTISNTATDGDPRIDFVVSGNINYAFGINDGDSDKFIFEYGSGALGTDPVLEVTNANTANRVVTIPGTKGSGSSSTGALVIGGGLGVGEDLYVADHIVIGDSEALDKMIRFDGNEIDYYLGLDDGDNLFVLGEGNDTAQKRGITIDTNQQVAIPATTDSTSSTTGAMIVSGGVGIAKRVNVASHITLLSRSELRYADTDSSNYVSFKAPATVSSDVTWTLPSADGSSNQVLKTDGSGTLSWSSTAAATDMSTDSTPQLGGNLDVNSQVIVSSSNENISMVPHGTGIVNITGNATISNTITTDKLRTSSKWVMKDFVLGPSDNQKQTVLAHAYISGGTEYIKTVMLHSPPMMANMSRWSITGKSNWKWLYKA
jgi:hypothetical protein